MWLTFSVTVLLASEIGAHFLDITKCVKLGEKTYKTEVIAEGLNRPYQLSSYNPNHEIYFSFNVGADQTDTFEIACIRNNMSEYEVIKGIKNGFATAVDDAHHTVYFGGSDGVYKKELKGKNNNITKVINNFNVWDMFFKRHLYVVSYPSQKLYKFIGKGKKIEPESRIHEKIYQFAIDGEDDIFITNATGLYLIKNNTAKRHLLQGEKDFRAIAVNNDGKAYFAGKNAIYVPVKTNHTLHKIADIQNIFGLTFDAEDDMVYSNPQEIMRLVPEECKAT